MASVFRLVASEGRPSGEAETIDGIIELARSAPPGDYRIVEVSPDLATGGIRSMDWGGLVKEPDGGIKLDLPPWID